MKSTILALVAFACVTIVRAETPVPDGYTLQIMEPLGGKILRPNGWFYAESHNGPSLTWIIAKEDPAKGPYKTGVRVQALVGVKKGTGKEPKDFVLAFIEGKKAEASKIVKSCSASPQGLFTRVCLETEEDDFHILYSLFWGNEQLDLVVVSIAGAPKKEWKKYSDTFDQMSGFELIDMTRFEKEEGEPGATDNPDDAQRVREDH